MASIQDAGLSGAELRRAFLNGFDRLEEYRDTVNALNVFPVPDGDTGTNMSLTLPLRHRALPGWRRPDCRGDCPRTGARDFLRRQGQQRRHPFPVLQGFRRCPSGARDLLRRRPCHGAGYGPGGCLRGSRQSARRHHAHRDSLRSAEAAEESGQRLRDWWRCWNPRTWHPASR